jgi:SAM-dependent methyltransferase
MNNFSPSCERNKAAIYQYCFPYLKTRKRLLEIGSWSGQHAIHIAPLVPEMYWQTSDLAPNIEALKANLLNEGITNIGLPFSLDVAKATDWPVEQYDVLYTANTLHIMSWSHVKALFLHLSKSLRNEGIVIVYGPFKYKGEYTSQSNAEFELWLKDRDIQSGIRNFEAVNELAISAGLTLVEDIDMPANNQLLIWQKNR